MPIPVLWLLDSTEGDGSGNSYINLDQIGGLGTKRLAIIVIKFLRFYMIFELGQNVLYKTFNLEFKFMRFDRYAALTIFLFVFQVEEIEEGK